MSLDLPQEMPPGTPVDWAPPRLPEGRSAISVRAWVPERPAVGWLIPLAGYNGDGRAMVDDPRWRSLAARLSLAIAGAHLADVDMGELTRTGGTYYYEDEGTVALLEQALAHAAAQARQPALAQAPWAAIGFSAGGQQAYGLACFRPERTRAFVAVKGGYYFPAAGAATLQVPGLFVAGEKDEWFRRRLIHQRFITGRRLGARWAHAEEPGSGHEPGAAPALAERFVEAAWLAAGLAESSRDRAPWIGDRSTRAIAPESAGAVDLRTTVWLPDEATARAWVEFGAGKAVV